MAGNPAQSCESARTRRRRRKQDVPLLDRLVTEKLKVEAEAIAAEGWKWIAVAVDFPYGHTIGLREIEGEPADLTEEERATLDALNAEHAKIEEDYQDADELPDEIDQRLGEIEAARSVLESRSLIYDPAQIARAGVFISIDAEGLLSIARGYVRPEDEAPVIVEPERSTGDGETNDDATTNGVVQRAVICRRRQPNPSGRTTTTRSAAAGSAHHRADCTSHTGIAQCAGERSPSPSRRYCTLRVGDLLPLLVVERLPANRHPDPDVPCASARLEGECVSGSYRRAP